MTRHTGPYNTLGRTYVELLGRWMPRSGRNFQGVDEVIGQ
jgi:hypothetical protein